jgi:SAM-dependent methyltransferase
MILLKRILKKFIPLKTYKSLSRIKNDFLSRNLKKYKLIVKSAKDMNGLEIGGPSIIFKNLIPIYKFCSSMEFANYSVNTVWHESIDDSIKYYRNLCGKLYITEATNLVFDDKSYDFILSSNVLEHIANPIKAFYEWKRVARCYIILMLPKKESNFDHNRPVTLFSHLVDDFKNNTSEYDLTHLDEILSLHDLLLDPPAGDHDNFKRRSLMNYENRCLHHHVFDSDLVRRMCDFIDVKIIYETFTKTDLIYLIKVD